MADPQYEKPRKEHLDVVMLKLGVSDLTATPEDFKRVQVQAPDADAATFEPQVTALEKEYRVLTATPPGHETQAEMLARHRAYNGGVTDPRKIGFEDPVGAMPPGEAARRSGV